MKEKTFTKSEISEIIYNEIKKVMHNKNEYIRLNGYTHVDTLNSFSTSIATLCGMYHLFEE